MTLQSGGCLAICSFQSLYRRAKISPATRKVRKVAAELGYRPSFIAQSLITRRSTLIGIVVRTGQSVLLGRPR